ncbi:16129_t:CDS:2, partial [Funneliformis geosporum]
YLAVRDKLLELINSLLKEEELKKQLKQDKVHIQKELNDTLAILNKPTTEMGTQTDLTAEQITQMETELKQLKEVDLPRLNQEKQQNEQELKNQIGKLEQKVKDVELTDEEKAINKTFPHLGDLKLFCVKVDSFYLNINQIRSLNAKLNQLQIEYDMEVKTKQQLLDYLNVYRKQNLLCYTDDVLEENKVGIEEFLGKHLGWFTKVNYLIFKLTSDRVIDFNWIKKIASDFSLCIEIGYSRVVSDKLPAPKIILNNLPKHFKEVDKLPHE